MFKHEQKGERVVRRVKLEFVLGEKETSDPHNLRSKDDDRSTEHNSNVNRNHSHVIDGSELYRHPHPWMPRS